MEKEIILVNTINIFSNKKNQEYYIIHFVDCDNKVCKEQYVSLETYNKITSKLKEKQLQRCKGIFITNQFDKLIISDVK